MATMKNDGKTTLATRAIANTPAAFTYMAVSEDTTAESATGTTLTGEITDSGLARASVTCTNPSSYVTQWTHTWTATAIKAIRKVAIFNASSGGNMLMEHLFTSAYTTASGSSLTIVAQMITSGE